jgi:hypothetical protein
MFTFENEIVYSIGITIKYYILTHIYIILHINFRDGNILEDITMFL